MTQPTADDYARLLEFRTGLRRFLRWSEARARASGLTAQQHQLLLAIRGSRTPGGPTIAEVADLLTVRHHSAVGLVDRAQQAGLVQRDSDAEDGRIVHLGLTPAGERAIAEMSSAHLEELARLAPRLRALWAGLDAAPEVAPRNAS